MSRRSVIVYSVMIAVAVAASWGIRHVGDDHAATALTAFRREANDETRRVAAAIDGEIARIRRDLRTAAAALAAQGSALGGSAAAAAPADEPVFGLIVARPTTGGGQEVRRLSLVAVGSAIEARLGAPIPGAAAERAALAEAIDGFRRAAPPVRARGETMMTAFVRPSVGRVDERAGSVVRGDPVFASPVFDGEGRVVGAVAAIVPAAVLRRLLPGAGHALVDEAGRILMRSSEASLIEGRLDAVRAGRSADDLPYSATVPFGWPDGRGWFLWAGRSESDFLTDPRHVAARLREIGALLLVWSLAGAVAVLRHRLAWRRARLERDAEDLAGRIERILRGNGVVALEPSADRPAAALGIARRIGDGEGAVDGERRAV